MASRKPKGPDPAIPRQFSVDYAPTGRASCKCCGRTIEMNAPRFLRKVKSPWHDGFDIQNNHLCCGNKWAEELGQIHGLGMLTWEDFLSAADEWEADVDLSDPEVQRLKDIQTAVHEVRQTIVDGKLPAGVLIQVLTANDFPEASLHKLKPPVLAHIIADQITRGKLPPCPVCQSNALVPAGYEVHCVGWVDATTRCDFTWCWNPVAKVKSTYDGKLGKEFQQRLKGRENGQIFYVPNDMVQPAWKKLPGILKNFKGINGLKTSLARVRPPQEERNATSVKPAPTPSVPIDQIPEREICRGAVFIFIGTLRNSRAELQGFIEEQGGKIINTLSGEIPVGWQLYGVTNAENWQIVRKMAKVENAIAAGAPILDEEYIYALTQHNSDVRGAVANKKVAEIQGTDDMPVGPILREHRYMRYYYVGGSPARTIPYPGPQNQTASKSKREVGQNSDRSMENEGGKSLPRIKRKSKLMTLDAEFFDNLGSQNVFGDIDFSIFVDNQNHAYNCSLTFCDLATGRNSFYTLQLVEQHKKDADEKFYAEVRQGSEDNPKKRRAPKGEPSKSKRPKKGHKHNTDENGGEEHEDVDDENVPPNLKEKNRNVSYQSYYIDYSEISHEDYETLRQHYKRPNYYLLRRWGRTGGADTRMNDSMVQPFDHSLESAVHQFETKFKDLTGIEFKERFTRQRVPGRYQFVDIEGYDYGYSKGDIGSSPQKQEMSKGNLETAATTGGSFDEGDDDGFKLPNAVEDLIKLIFNRDLLVNTLKAMSLDTAKIDLESLSVKQLESGFTVLRELEEVIHQRQREARNKDQIALSRVKLQLQGLTSQFYTILPRAFDRNAVPPPITTMRELKINIQMLDDFIQTANSAHALKEVKKDNSGLTGCYRGMMYDLEWIDRTQTPIGALVAQMVKNCHGATHTSFQLELTQLFALKSRNPPPQLELQNRKLLWHGSRLSNWAGIMSRGLRIAPSEAPVTGYMFDKGVYFADMASKSAQYCYASDDYPQAILMLCEVALGKQFCRVEALESARRRSKELDCQSTWGVGKTGPTAKAYVASAIGTSTDVHLTSDKATDQCAVEVPCGEPGDQSKLLRQVAKEPGGGKTSQLLYNEFVVYNTAQIIPRYLVEVEFKFESFLREIQAVRSVNAGNTGSSSSEEDESEEDLASD